MAHSHKHAYDVNQQGGLKKLSFDQIFTNPKISRWNVEAQLFLGVRWKSQEHGGLNHINRFFEILPN